MVPDAGYSGADVRTLPGVFDGTKCRLAAGDECGDTRGAFDNVEACAAACSAAAHCNDEDLDVEGDEMREMCALTLLPHVIGLFCFNNL